MKAENVFVQDKRKEGQERRQEAILDTHTHKSCGTVANNKFQYMQISYVFSGCFSDLQFSRKRSELIQTFIC